MSGRNGSAARGRALYVSRPAAAICYAADAKPCDRHPETWHNNSSMRPGLHHHAFEQRGGLHSAGPMMRPLRQRRNALIEPMDCRWVPSAISTTKPAQGTLGDRTWRPLAWNPSTLSMPVFDWGTGRIARRQRCRNADPLSGEALPTEGPAVWVGAPRTTCSEFKHSARTMRSWLGSSYINVLDVPPYND